jgi:hypothetical protein
MKKINYCKGDVVIQKDTVYNAIRAMQSYASDALFAAAQRPIMDTGATSDASHKPEDILEDLPSQFRMKAATGAPTYMRAMRMECATFDVYGNPLLFVICSSRRKAKNDFKPRLQQSSDGNQSPVTAFINTGFKTV